LKEKEQTRGREEGREEGETLLGSEMKGKERIGFFLDFFNLKFSLQNKQLEELGKERVGGFFGLFGFFGFF